MTLRTLREELTVTCTGHGPGHGRNGGLAPEDLPMGEVTDGGFVPVTFGGGSGGRFEVIIEGRRRTAWNCDSRYAGIYCMLDRCGPVYYHPETSLLVAGEPAIRRFLSISWEPPTPCKKLTGDAPRRAFVTDMKNGAFLPVDRRPR